MTEPMKLLPCPLLDKGNIRPGGYHNGLADGCPNRKAIDLNGKPNAGLSADALAAQVDFAATELAVMKEALRLACIDISNEFGTLEDKEQEGYLARARRKLQKPEKETT